VSAPLRVGSLCSGYGGLEMGAELALGPLHHVWHGEFDAAPSAVLEARWPGVPNLGDIAAVTAGTSPHGTWANQEPIDLLCAGYPCQGESDAGLRRGEDDPRFRWPDVWAAIRALRPRLVFLENVRGHLNRSFPRVVADLSASRYVGRWQCVRASDAGAAHRRERLFIVAWPEETPAPWLRGTAAPGLAGDLTTLLPTPLAADGDRASATFARGNPTLLGALLPTPRTSDANGAGQHGDGGMDLRTAVSLLPTPRARDGKGRDPNPKGVDLNEAVALLPTPTVADSRGPRNATSGRQLGSEHHDGWTLSDVAYADRWGAYGPAIARWETVVGRPAPAPTVARKGGRRQLSPQFVEWLMGLPAGHVTDVVTKRGDALRVLGNGVVPQAAALALRRLLTEPERPDHVQPDLFDLAGAQ
jgi:DNA (cytosine-5)-methyltransferase 1